MDLNQKLLIFILVLGSVVLFLQVQRKPSLPPALLDGYEARQQQLELASDAQIALYNRLNAKHITSVGHLNDSGKVIRGCQIDAPESDTTLWLNLYADLGNLEHMKAELAMTTAKTVEEKDAEYEKEFTAQRAANEAILSKMDAVNAQQLINQRNDNKKHELDLETTYKDLELEATVIMARHKK